ncbi:GNAT family N-acetyltransferase [Inconstantimicrobium mannanitabidum]|uniref:Uncharacterized protein n=1 Tax=Inconstantimicrobium mannanitabidum TaxID=1604901 RepID=A0ACB5RAG1_9CLOT|nr:GNAT family protein [Clostridium sp. TW13]GKX66087.1 hypothetical protein rsdtw13_13450 [Clostridium sp. TW13]
MNIFRVTEKEEQFLKYKKSYIHSTAFIAKQGEDVIGIFEYNINGIVAEITNILLPCSKNQSIRVVKGFIEELSYWNPYVNSVVLKNEISEVDLKTLKSFGFIADKGWMYEIDNASKLFKLSLSDIVPEQLTVDEKKVHKAISWVNCPRDVMVGCVEIDNKILVIDGYSRLVVAVQKGFSYVYGYMDKGNDNDEQKAFYKTCFSWCQEAGVNSVYDFNNRIVSSEEHKKIWIDRCQRYFKEKANEGLGKVKTLESKRLILRGWKLEDLDDFYQYAKNPKVGPNAGWAPHESKETTLSILNSFIEKQQVWAIQDKESGSVIGSIGLHDDHKRSDTGAKMLGYVLSEDYWGKGIMPEAVQEILKYAFEEANVQLISVYHYDFNTTSKRVIEKVGFKFEGILRAASKRYDGKIFDDYCYSMLRQEYSELIK